MTSGGPATHPLGTGDLYDVFMDRRMRAGGGPGNGSQILYELDGPIDVEVLRRRLDDLLAACPVLGARLTSWPVYRWTEGEGHRIPLEVVDGEPGALALFNERFGRTFPPLDRPGFEVIVAPGEARSLLMLRWLHALMDAPGAELLVRLIDGADPARFRLFDDPPTLNRRARGGSIPRLAVAVHNFLLRYLARSLPPPHQRRTDRADPTSRLLAHTFDEGATAAIDRRAAEVAGPLQANHFLMGVAFLAARDVLRPGRFASLLIPCPVNLRPPAWRGPVFANYFTSVLTQLPARRITGLAGAVAAVRDRFRILLSRKEDAAAFWMMGLVRYLPHPLYKLLMLGPTGRDPASLYYSNVVLDTPEGTLLGRRVVRCLAASTVLNPPGAALVFIRCGGRLTVEVSARGCPWAEELLGRAVAILREGA